MRTYPNFRFERRLWSRGYKFVAGIDEVGRGSFAGPVVAAAVAFAPDSNEIPKGITINDSKKLTPRARERASFWIKKKALCYGIGRASVSQINRLGIKKASEIAFRKAIINCKFSINYLLIDAFYIPYVKGLRRKNQKPVIKGDTKSFSIAGASIIAKVYRDKLMTDIGKKKKFRKYKWAKNKGYGTKEHREAIKKYGLTRQHRKTFVETWLNNSSSFQAR